MDNREYSLDWKQQLEELSKKQAENRIEQYKKTEHYALLMQSLNQKHISFSDFDMFKLLAFSSDIYYKIEQDFIYNKDNNYNTFWNILSIFYSNNPLLFSISEIVKLSKSVKYLIFIKPKWFSLVKPIIDKYKISYDVYDAMGTDHALTAFSFVQTYNSNEEWKKANNNCSSIAQIIQQDIQEVNGITADLFSLYLRKDYCASFAILSPGSCLDLFTGNEREFQSFFRKDLQQLFRSSWEANIARILNYKGLSWEYESQRILLQENTLYIPDFFLNNGSILEVKGFWDNRSRKKITEFKKEKPETPLLVVDSDMYYSLQEKYKTLIPEWEESKSAQNSYYETIPIVGISFNATKETISSLNVDDTILFKREPDNKYDKYAILATTKEGLPVGHVGSDWSFIYASKMDIGMEFIGSIKEISNKIIQVKIHRSNKEIEIIYDFLA